MKKYFKSILSAVILTIFLLAAGGSSEGEIAFWFISMIALFIIMVIYQLVNSSEEEIIKKQKKIEDQERNKNKLEELKSTFNAPITKVINYDIQKYVFISEEKSLIMLNEHIYHFKDILDFTLSDNSVVVFTPTTSKTTTNTGSMLGRAIVGGVLTGGVGAVIGGATASQTTQTSKGTSHTKHDYTLVITVNNLSNPVENIHIGWRENYAREISSILSIIVSRNMTN
jgi:hypothetical protein